MRPTQHLREIVSLNGSGNATEAIVEVLSRGLFALEAQKREARIAEKGTGAKQNPYISDAGKCPRAVTYSLMNVEESDPVTVDSLVNFLVGHKVEDAFADILAAAGATVLREERVSIPTGGTVVTGRKDFSGVQIKWTSGVAKKLGVECDIPEGTIVELKATNSRAMGFMLKKGLGGRDEHRRQLGLYLYADNQPLGVLLYVIKDATKGEPIAHAFFVERDEAAANSDLQDLASAHALAKSGMVAPIPVGQTQSTYPCTYCSYRAKCWLDASTEAKVAVNE